MTPKGNAMASFAMYEINEGQPKIVTAFFHKKPGALSRDEIEKQVPKEIVIRKELPLTSVGKLDKKQLRKNP